MIPDQGLIRLCRQLDRHVHPCLMRCAVSDARMPPLAVVEDFDVFKEGSSGFPAGSEPGAVDHLSLQRSEEAFHWGVVQAIALPAHRRGHAVQTERLLVFAAGVLDAPI